MQLSDIGVTYDPRLYTSTGHVKWGHHELLKALDHEEDAIEAGTLRIIMADGVWQVPPEARPPLRPDLTYPT